MKKIFASLVLCIFFVLFLASCETNGPDTNNAYYPTVQLPPPPAGIDSDGDTMPDATDCAPNDPTRWRLVNFWPDADNDGLADYGSPNFPTQICVGNAIPPNWTPFAPPPLDRCLNDSTNSCQTVRPYLEIIFDFDETKTSWQVNGTCFIQPTQTDPFPKMGAGQGASGDIISEVNSLALGNDSCIFAINFEPAITNACGIVNDLPCQLQGILYDGTGNNGLASMQIFFNPTGYATDEISLPFTVIDNGFGGGNYLIGFGLPNPGGNVNIITTLHMDTDGDGLFNPEDNCIWVQNPDQAANLSNPLYLDPITGLLKPSGDACQTIDNDNDGWLNAIDLFPNDFTLH